MSSQIPQELVEGIIDHLSGDSISLKACALVCHAWVPRSRSHLFATCTLVPRNILTFLQLLSSPHGCTFVSHVRAITASRHDWTQTDRYFNAIAGHLRGLVNVRSLTMKLSSVLPHFNLDNFLSRGFITGFPHVTELVLVCTFGRRSDPVPLLDIICLLPALQHLSFHGLTDFVIAKHTEHTVPPHALRSLSLALSDSVNPILSWLHSFNHLPKVESLSLPFLYDNDAPIIRTALRQLGNALRHLELVVTWVTTYGAIDPAVFDLSIYLNLRTVTIHDRSPWSDPEHFDAEYLVLFLLKLAAPTLEAVSLDIELTQYRNMDWARLDAFFSTSRFPRLTRVIFLRSNPDDEDFLHAALPLLSASGTLTRVL
ncbi:hypothetical protein B0H11DRAFT_2236985 [Mycena galericulata]|nr:hypothetical protein B0H11DRAFT_2236985 [Mycena galericulata]